MQCFYFNKVQSGILVCFFSPFLIDILSLMQYYIKSTHRLALYAVQCKRYQILNMPPQFRIERLPPNIWQASVLCCRKTEYFLNTPPYLTGIEGPPPKRTNYGSLKEAARDNFVKFKI